jgi:hypothetical protein
MSTPDAAKFFIEIGVRSENTEFSLLPPKLKYSPKLFVSEMPIKNSPAAAATGELKLTSWRKIT